MFVPLSKVAVPFVPSVSKSLYLMAYLEDAVLSRFVPAVPRALFEIKTGQTVCPVLSGSVKPD